MRREVCRDKRGIKTVGVRWKRKSSMMRDLSEDGRTRYKRGAEERKIISTRQAKASECGKVRTM